MAARSGAAVFCRQVVVSTEALQGKGWLGGRHGSSVADNAAAPQEEEQNCSEMMEIGHSRGHSCGIPVTKWMACTVPASMPITHIHTKVKGGEGTAPGWGDRGVLEHRRSPMGEYCLAQGICMAASFRRGNAMLSFRFNLARERLVATDLCGVSFRTKAPPWGLSLRKSAAA